MTPLVILRPQPGASASAEAAIRLGLEPLLLPLFEIEPVAWAKPDPKRFDALLLTSANAVRNAGPGLGKLRGLPAYAVGEATAAEARAAGLTIAFAGGSGVDDLLQAIGPELRLLHLCGEQYREPAGAGQPILHLPVYRAVAIPEIAGLERIAGAVAAVHSPRAGARLAELAAARGLDVSSTIIAAISAEAALAAGSGWRAVEVADQPNDSALLALAAGLCQNRD